jgi:hypothetical protein
MGIDEEMDGYEFLLGWKDTHLLVENWFGLTTET